MLVQRRARGSTEFPWGKGVVSNSGAKDRGERERSLPRVVLGEGGRLFRICGLNRGCRRYRCGRQWGACDAPGVRSASDSSPVSSYARPTVRASSRDRPGRRRSRGCRAASRGKRGRSGWPSRPAPPRRAVGPEDGRASLAWRQGQVDCGLVHVGRDIGSPIRGPAGDPADSQDQHRSGPPRPMPRQPQLDRLQTLTSAWSRSRRLSHWTARSGGSREIASEQPREDRGRRAGGNQRAPLLGQTAFERRARSAAPANPRRSAGPGPDRESGRSPAPRWRGRSRPRRAVPGAKRRRGSPHLHLVPQAADEPADPRPAAGSPEVARRPPDRFGIFPVPSRQVVALGLLGIERTRWTEPRRHRELSRGSPPPLKAVGDVDDAGRQVHPLVPS